MLLIDPLWCFGVGASFAAYAGKQLKVRPRLHSSHLSNMLCVEGAADEQLVLHVPSRIPCFSSAADAVVLLLHLP